MSQSKIIKILEKLDENVWVSTVKLTQILKINRSNVISNLNKMRIYGEIESRRMLSDGQNPQTEHRLTLRGRS